jgi:heptosyltransferase-2
LRPVVVGSAGEAALGQRIAGAVPGALDLCGKVALEDVVDILAAARLVVANDSGLMHVAAAVGTPLVAVYGATSPDDTPPLSPAARSVALELGCQPCRRHVCPLGHTNCLVQLDPERVLAAARDMGVLATAA